MGEPGRDTSGVTTRVIVLYLREHGGDRAVAALLERAGETRSADELLDEHGWSSYQQKIRLFRAAVEVLDDPGAVRRIGQSMLRSRIALPLLVLLRGPGSPEQVLRNVAKANSRFSTNSTVRALEIGNGHAVVSYRLHQGFVPDLLDCQYTEGLLSLVPEVFGLPAASVHHDECQVRGAPACLYRLSWRPRHRWSRRVQAEQAQLRDQLEAITQRFRELQSVCRRTWCRPRTSPPSWPASPPRPRMPCGPPGTCWPPGRPRSRRCGCTTRASPRRRRPPWASG